MIQTTDGIFVLNTLHTTYAFGVLPTGQLEHLYYGRKIRLDEPLEEAVRPLREQHVFQPGNSVVYDREHENYTLEDMCLEMSSYGKGDIREPFVEILYGDGSLSSDFVYDSYEILEQKETWNSLPTAVDDGRGGHLKICLKDRNSSLILELFYDVYEDCDVICRRSRLSQEGEETVRIRRLMSCQIDFPEPNYRFTTFCGAWAREMRKYETRLQAGRLVNDSYTGTTSNRANSFVMLGKDNTGEDLGDAYGFHLLYSGNHYEALEVNAYGKTRLVTGINPRSFSWELKQGEAFEAPEAVLAYSHKGYNGMSQCMHKFIRDYIVRGSWQKKDRPVLLNSWEASYFDINEKKLLSLAKAGKEVGIELFVMDDGWFGQRNDDKTSLGDWKANEKKLPGGVEGICKKINDLGLDFGIWVEPEMISTDSELFRTHPDWAMEIPGKDHAEGRNQKLLDLSRKEVQDFIIDEMSNLFSSAPISYVKWDMNRIVSDSYSQDLSADKQGEVAHRYVLGLYRCMKELTEKFPEILFEGCAAGGNRFDPGILCYFPQIWSSDDTDALCRTEIQTGYSYGYPPSVISNHVSSCPNHQTLRLTPLETRFQVAAFGVLGYECNLKDTKKEDLEAIKEQIALYKKWRKTLQFGNFYRGRSFTDAGSSGSVLAGTEGNLTEWTMVSEDQKQAAGLYLQKLVQPNTQYAAYYPKGLLEDQKYHFYNRRLKHNIKEFGDLINTVAPLHVRQDSPAHQLMAKFVKLDGELEDFKAYGETLMYSGVKLKAAFGGTGFNDQVRHFPDFASRMYFMESVVL